MKRKAHKAKHARSKKARRATHRRRAHAPKARPAAARSATRVDGVNVNDLVVMAETVKNDPARAEYKFRANTTWLGGAHARTRIQSFWGSGQEDHSRRQAFVLEADEPPAILGANHGPNPIEYALAGIGSSLSETIAYNAAARGIKIDGIEIELEGGLDLRGFLGIRESAKAREGSKNLRPGLEQLRIVCHIKSEAPPSELKELVDLAQQTAPLLDMLRNPVPVALELQH